MYELQIYHKRKKSEDKHVYSSTLRTSGSELLDGSISSKGDWKLRKSQNYCIKLTSIIIKLLIYKLSINRPDILDFKIIHSDTGFHSASMVSNLL